MKHHNVDQLVATLIHNVLGVLAHVKTPFTILFTQDYATDLNTYIKCSW